MKKLFAVFCAVCLMPTFSAQAWVGGPFSNYNFSGQGGADGIWEGVVSGTDVVGITRFAIGNTYAGVGTPTTTTPQQTAAGGGGAIITTPSIASGNAVIGAFASTTSAVFYFEGDFYGQGTTLGSVSPSSGSVVALGNSTDGANTIEFYYRGSLTGSGGFAYSSVRAPQRSFTASGQITDTGAVAGEVAITVFGTKVSDQILLGL